MSTLLLLSLWLVGCSTAASPAEFITQTENGAYGLDLSQIRGLTDEAGRPVSTRITDDTSLGTVHTFDLFPVIVTSPTRSEDGLWRLQFWNSTGNSLAEEGFLVTLVLGYDDTVIEFDLLPQSVFEWKSGHTAAIAEVVPQLSPGQQIFVHVIADHSFTEEDIQAISALGFDYASLTLGYQEQNLAILEALRSGKQPPDGEVRGLGALYLGIE